jgi:uncharacterized protein (TIGR02246 family)
MPKRLRLTAGLTAAAALCAGLWAHAQNQPAAPGAGKTSAAKSAPAKSESAPPAKNTPAETVKTSEEIVEQEIRAGADAFTELYNKHDAAGLAALFAESAEMVDEDGKLMKGRIAIQAEFAQQFENQPECTMRVDVDTVRVLTPHLALEEGVARCTAAPGELEEITNYTCLHVKTEDQWLLASVTDFAAVAENLTPHEHLQELAWLLGEWIDETPDSNVHSLCDWDESGNFLMYHFQAQLAGQVSMTGTTRIGWDAVAKQFRSWVFDSEGGFSEGIWFPQGDEWIVKAIGATADGETCSSTNVYRMIDNDTFTFRSHDRIVDGELTADIGEFLIKRRAPPPLDDADEK